jgi:hypothetical protein
VRAWTSRQHGAVELVELAGVDHFFHGRLNELRTVLENALGAAAQALPKENQGSPDAEPMAPSGASECAKERPERTRIRSGPSD